MRESKPGRGRERGGDRGSEAGLALTAESYEGLELTKPEIMTWAEVRRLTEPSRPNEPSIAYILMKEEEIRVKAASLLLTMQILELRNQHLEGISHCLKYYLLKCYWNAQIILDDL